MKMQTKTTVSVLAVFLLMLCTVFSTVGYLYDDGMSGWFYAYQWIPSVFTGAVLVLILRFGGLIRGSLMKSAPFYLLIAAVCTVCWALQWESAQYGWEDPRRFGYGFLFMKAEMRIPFNQVHPYPATGALLMLCVGAAAALFALSLIRNTRAKSLHLAFRPDGNTPVALLIPLLFGFLHTWYEQLIFNIDIMHSPLQPILGRIVIALPLLAGSICGWLLCRKKIFVNRIISTFIVVGSLVITAWIGMMPRSPLSYPDYWYSPFPYIWVDCGIFFGIAAGIAAKALFRKAKGNG